MCAAAAETKPIGASPGYLSCAVVSSGIPAGSILLKNRFGYLKAALGPRATVCVEAKLVS